MNIAALMAAGAPAAWPGGAAGLAGLPQELVVRHAAAAAQAAAAQQALAVQQATAAQAAQAAAVQAAAVQVAQQAAAQRAAATAAAEQQQHQQATALAAAAAAASLASTPSAASSSAPRSAVADTSSEARARSRSPPPRRRSPPPAARDDKAAAEPQSKVEDVPRCHLHKKANKACKFCKAHTAFLEAKNKEAEDMKTAALEKLRGGGGPKTGGSHEDKVPLPNAQYFPSVLRDRIVSSNFYGNVLVSGEFSEVREELLECETAEPEVRGLNLDAAPSPFISIVYRLLCLKPTEGQLRSLLNNKNRWVRCAGFVLVRLGVQQDRFWELLSDALLDIEEFVPFPGKGGEKMTEGQYVEHLLMKEKYCDLSLPRIAVAQKKMLNERLVLYDQFRRRYAANLEVVDRYASEDGGEDVEVCTVDGDWHKARTCGAASSGRRRVTVPVKFAVDKSGGEHNISLGMLISPSSRGSSDPQDLTRSRGRSYQELLDRFRAAQKDSAVASGKDYCKNSGRRTVHAGGMTFIAGEKGERGGGGGRRSREEEGNADEEEARLRESRKDREKTAEHQAKMAAIMEKYCQAGRSQDRRSQSSYGVEEPDRMRLG